MALDENTLRRFFHETKHKASEIISQPHHGAELISLIKDLLTICNNLDALLDQSSGQSADSRVLKKKLNEAKAANDASVASMKKMVSTIADEITTILSETNQIMKRPADDAGTASATRIRASAQKIVATIVKGSQAA